MSAERISPYIHCMHAGRGAPAAYMLKCLCLFSAILAVALLAFPEAGFAQSNIGDTICTLASYLSGPAAKAMATVVVIASGYMAMFGRTSWSLPLVIGLGIALLFGASDVLTALGKSYACGAPQSFNFACNGPTASGNLFDADTMSAQQGACAPGSQLNGKPCGAFAQTLFMFKDTVGQIMSQMYCAFTDAMKGPMKAAATLFVTVCGIMIMSGMAHFTIKEAGVMMFKLALVLTFALNADWGIGIAYKFFINVAEEGTQIVLSAVPHAPGTTPSITDPDTVLSGIFYTSSTGATTNGTGGLAGVPQICLLYMMLIVMALGMFMPILVIFLLLMVINYVGNFARALLNYLTSLVLISFLFIFAPLFIGFALFRTTLPLFEAWIKNLTAFSLQMIIMFAFMVLLALLPFAQFFTELLNLLKEYDKTFEFGACPACSAIPMHFCGICQYLINGNDITCVLHQGATAQAAASTAPGYMLSADHNYYVISLFNLFQRTDFVKFVIIESMALFLLSKVIGDFINKAPQIAAALGKLPIAAAIGGGKGPQGEKINFAGLESLEAGYLGFKNAIGTRHSFNPVKDWQGRLGSLVINRKGAPIKDEEGNITGYKKRGIIDGLMHGAVMDSILHGASDQSSLSYKEKKNKIARAQKRYAKVEERQKDRKEAQKEAKETMDSARRELEDMIAADVNPQDIEAQRERLAKAYNNFYKRMDEVASGKKELTQAMAEYNSATLTGDTSHKKGLLKTGKIASSLYMSGYSANDQTQAKIMEQARKRHEKKEYGHALPLEKRNYYFMQMTPDAQDLPRIRHEHAEDVRKDAQAQLDALQSSVASAAHFMPEGKVAHIEAMISMAGKQLSAAGDASQIQEAVKSISSIAGLLRSST